MRRIRLTRGRWATVDDRFYEKLVAMGSWFTHGQGYAARNVYHPETQRCSALFMHQVVGELAGLPVGRLDHRNGRKRDNRVRNLRPASHAENNRNRPKQSNNTSGYKGVSWSKAAGKWTARIKGDGRYRHLGLFSSKRRAAVAYDKAARKYHGRFARTNFK